MALEKEIETYQRELSTFEGQEGKFVLVHENEVAGTFGTYEDALKEGYEKFGLKPFLVKQISAVEQLQFVTRELVFR